MSNLAIILGNSTYKTLPNLECCSADVEVMEELLAETGRYQRLRVLKDADADQVKTELRLALSEKCSEVFFYFSGHGCQIDGEFFYCAANFDGRRPNETGISTTELHTLLRLAEANLVVKLIDACNSGSTLVKSNAASIFQSKHPFENLIQIASCLQSQEALTGDPISIFTESFRSAALRKTDGPVFYTDIIATLRDEYIENNLQTPFFVSQQTGREQFVDDASCLSALRLRLEKIRLANEGPQAVISSKSLLERLQEADAKVASPHKIQNFCSKFFDGLSEKIAASNYNDYFILTISEFDDFRDVSSEDFMIDVLSSEKRPDELVTAINEQKLKKSNPLLSRALMQGFLGSDAYEQVRELKLNCSMSRTQIRVQLLPKFLNLHKINLVVTCAPSLDHCYVFEYATQHLLTDFDRFQNSGAKISRRWWRVRWCQGVDGIISQIDKMLSEALERILLEAEQRVSKDT